MNIQWYPGHMTKAKRQMQEDMKLIDLIIELVDARVPQSQQEPGYRPAGTEQKSRLILLNKADLADERQNAACGRNTFKEQGLLCSQSRFTQRFGNENDPERDPGGLQRKNRA